LAEQARTRLQQTTQQAIQAFLHRCPSMLAPIYASSCAPSSTQQAYGDAVVAYLQQHGFPDITSSEVTPTVDYSTVTVGSTVIKAQQVSVRVDYGFPVVAPVLDYLNLGPLQGGKIMLGATASIVATVDPVTTPTWLICKATDSSGNEIDEQGKP